MSVPLSRLKEFQKKKEVSDCSSCSYPPETTTDLDLVAKWHPTRPCFKTPKCQGWMEWDTTFEHFFCKSCHDFATEADFDAKYAEEIKNHKEETKETSTGVKIAYESVTGIRHKVPCMFPMHMCICSPDWIQAERERLLAEERDEEERIKAEREARAGRERLMAMIEGADPAIPVMVMNHTTGNMEWMIWSDEKGKMIPADNEWDFRSIRD